MNPCLDLIHDAPAEKQQCSEGDGGGGGARVSGDGDGDGGGVDGRGEGAVGECEELWQEHVIERLD